MHVVEIIWEVEAIVLAVMVCWQVVVGLSCTEFLERTFVLVGALATVWCVARMLKNLGLNSNPRES